MKIRIQDNSIRFRLTLKEVDQLAKVGRVERHTAILGPAGPAGTFRYAIVRAPELAQSDVRIDGPSIVLHVCDDDLATLLMPHEEGIYLRREWTAQDGAVHRFMAFAEKDRPGSTCVKKEQWIYDAPHHGAPETRPIPARQG